MLEVKNIVKDYPIKANFGSVKRVVRAVDDVSFQVEKGESLALVGESGCGKTTLARIMMQLIIANHGQILFDKEVLTKNNLADYRRSVQMVFQDPFSSLDPRYTIRSIICEGMELAKKKYKSDQEKELRIQDILKAVGLKRAMLSRYPHEFSGGERQRIAIARALVLNPKLLILDEAVSSLDVIVQKQILDLLLDLQKQFQLTYIFISHNLRVVQRISDRVAVMYRGKIVELAPVDEIFNNPLHPYTKDLLSAALNYKVRQQNEEYDLGVGVKLVNQGGGHYLLK